jgi:hypothetical protein
VHLISGIHFIAAMNTVARRAQSVGDSGTGGDFHGEPAATTRTHPVSTQRHDFIRNQLARKPSYLGHTLVENRNGLIAAAMTTQADGWAERDAVLFQNGAIGGEPPGIRATRSVKANGGWWRSRLDG